MLEIKGLDFFKKCVFNSVFAVFVFINDCLLAGWWDMIRAVSQAISNVKIFRGFFWSSKSAQFEGYRSNSESTTRKYYFFFYLCSPIFGSYVRNCRHCRETVQSG
jgi:hypothetical protein